MAQRSRWLWVPALLLVATAYPADKKPAPKDVPRVTGVLPLGAAPGATAKLTIRGLKLDQASAVRFTDPKVKVKILGKGKAAVPPKQEAVKVGDTQVEVEVTLPREVFGGSLSFVVVTPAGQTAPHRLLVESTMATVGEKEPNDNFRQAQPIALPQVIDGVIQHPQDVDVFRFEGQAGQRIIVEVLAARYGSALDSLLTLYDADRRELTSSDDSGAGTDSRIDLKLPRSGTYYLVLMDAHDQGSPVHVYRLRATVGK